MSFAKQLERRIAARKAGIAVKPVDIIGKWGKDELPVVGVLVFSPGTGPGFVTSNGPGQKRIALTMLASIVEDLRREVLLEAVRGEEESLIHRPPPPGSQVA